MPLILSNTAMKKAKTHIAFQRHKITIFGLKIDIRFSSAGQYV